MFVIYRTVQHKICVCTNVQYESICLYWTCLLMYDKIRVYKYIYIYIFKYYNTSLIVSIKSLSEAKIKVPYANQKLLK